MKFKGIEGHDGEQIGESWELSGVNGNESIAANGEYEGRKLPEIVAELKEKLVGTDNYQRFGDTFPLLIKFIDAKQDLSIQVHPDDEKARKYGLKNGKTEMWYIMDSDADASLRCGMKHLITPKEYKAMVAEGTICDAIAEYPVKADDCFFIPAGRIHSIGTRAVSWRRYSRLQTQHTGFSTSTAATRTATCANCTPKKQQNVSTTACCPTTGRSMWGKRTRAFRLYTAPTLTLPCTTLTSL